VRLLESARVTLAGRVGACLAVLVEPHDQCAGVRARRPDQCTPGDEQRGDGNTGPNKEYHKLPSCVLPTRLLVHDAVYDDVVERVQALVANVTVGDPLDPATQMGPVIDANACERILGVIERAGAEGARLVTGGRRIAALEPGYFVAPTVFGDVDPASDLAQREVFGPVLSILRFADDTEAIALANGTNYGLGGFVFTRDLQRAHRTAAAFDAGYVGVNAFPMLPASAPFGGVKGSGFGREGGQRGIEEFLRVKNVFVDMA
jgi:acyl-CoA reductase-like NAD-dependent aldehyde dehydrogenase